VSRRQILIVALFFGVAYAVSAAIQGHVLPGIVTGVLGAALIYLLFVRVQEHQAAQRRRRERERG
jgi:hypothetical protein